MKSASKSKFLALPALSLMILAGLAGNVSAQTGGYGTPTNANPAAAEVAPNPANPNSGQSSYSTDDNSRTGSRPFPESSRNETRSGEFYRPSRPGVIGSDANEGERPAYVPPVSQQAAPANRAAAPAANSTNTNTSQAPQTQAPQQTMPNITVNGDQTDKPTINIIMPLESPTPVPDGDDPLGRDSVYRDVIITDNNDKDASEIPLWALGGGIAILLAVFASFATWWVIRRRNQAGYSQY